MAKPAPKNKLLALVLPAEIHATLDKMAKAAGVPVEDLAERFLREISGAFVRQVEAS
ncbi:hypothetical protein LB566_23380 [Mesorhizobium sp. CA13]|uniref:hypothetical protein n=1 Tax=Mesorhizobium sp. CA13 TaxID=2876643 RepID=UPI001CCAD93D|nr:hypothetical protein [Mesorhizobium sp. CA13]MBZ9856738.1 hypothetical protein [Mesorhizobium sp. CA13]